MKRTLKSSDLSLTIRRTKTGLRFNLKSTKNGQTIVAGQGYTDRRDLDRALELLSEFRYSRNRQNQGEGSWSGWSDNTITFIDKTCEVKL